MTDFEQLKQAKEKCLNDLVDALPLYKERIDSIDANFPKLERNEKMPAFRMAISNDDDVDSI